jgi:hypothetical protein
MLTDTEVRETSRPALPPMGSKPGEPDSGAQEASFAVEISIDNEVTWTPNPLRFATRTEAENYAKALSACWTLITDWRVISSSDPVNCSFMDGTLYQL